MATSLDTTVPVSRSQEAIRKLLRANGCDQMQFGDDFTEQRMFVMFRLVLSDPELGEAMLPVRVPVHLSAIVDLLKRAHPQKYRGQRGSDLAVEQSMRVAWRNVHDWLKASFTAVEVGIITAPEAFLSSVMTADGATIGEQLMPHLPGMLHHGTTLPLLESGKEIL